MLSKSVAYFATIGIVVGPSDKSGRRMEASSSPFPAQLHTDKLPDEFLVLLVSMQRCCMRKLWLSTKNKECY